MGWNLLWRWPKPWRIREELYEWGKEAKCFSILATRLSPSWYKLPWPAWFRKSVVTLFPSFSREAGGTPTCSLNGALEQRGWGVNTLKWKCLHWIRMLGKVFTCFLRSFWVYSLQVTVCRKYMRTFWLHRLNSCVCVFWPHTPMSSVGDCTFQVPWGAWLHWW